MADSDCYAMGMWTVRDGAVEEFLARWREFLEWTRGSADGFQQAFLVRSEGNPRHFVSYSTWDDAEARDRWRAMPEFAEKMGACRALCDHFQSDLYDRVVTVR